MNFKIESTENFKNEFRRLQKKYPSLKKELLELGNDLSKNPFQGVSLGNYIYKIRISISSKGKGKRGGGRVMTYVKVLKETVYLFSIYSKGEKNDISAKEIAKLLKEIPS